MSVGAGVGGEARAPGSDEERKPTPLSDDMCSEASGGAGGGGGAGGDAPRPATDELLVEAAMRTALAAEKQAEAVAQVRLCMCHSHTCRGGRRRAGEVPGPVLR